MEEKEMIYELGHWEPKYVLNLMGRLIEFHCFHCHKDFKGITAYEHFVICCPALINELRAGGERRLGHVKQERSDYLRTFGPSEEPQETLLLSFPGNDPKTVKEILSSRDVQEAIESGAEGFRNREVFGEDPKAPEGD